ncbi:hypothetical protein [Haladaptatus sp. W1]|uniref:hypothetical protein n=1 Tax=Haladaptatus sp. W1 TaxID=1897478 RepID=UPI0009F66C66|nr:hypothetical protein [Haladaptatus sp. W1]
MNRREVLRKGGLLLLTGVMTSLSGCGGIIKGVTSPLEVTSKDARSTSFGNVIVTARVSNQSDERQSGTLWGEVNIDGGSSYEESVYVTVPPNSDKDYEIKFDIKFSEFGEQYTYDAWVETE